MRKMIILILTCPEWGLDEIRKIKRWKVDAYNFVFSTQWTNGYIYKHA